MGTLTPGPLDGMAEELGAHLAEVLPPSDLGGAVYAIMLSAGTCVADRPSINEDRQHYKADRARLLAVAEHGRALLGLLRGSDWHPPGLDAGTWTAGLDVLLQVAEAAEIQAGALAEALPSGRGRPADLWRDNLIATIYGVYPAGAATKARGSHFERAVELALGYVGGDVEDTHDLILRALKRQPEPPFYVAMVRRR